MFAQLVECDRKAAVLALHRAALRQSSRGRGPGGVAVRRIGAAWRTLAGRARARPSMIAWRRALDRTPGSATRRRWTRRSWLRAPVARAIQAQEACGPRRGGVRRTSRSASGPALATGAQGARRWLDEIGHETKVARDAAKTPVAGSRRMLTQRLPLKVCTGPVMARPRATAVAVAVRRNDRAAPCCTRRVARRGRRAHRRHPPSARRRGRRRPDQASSWPDEMARATSPRPGRLQPAWEARSARRRRARGGVPVDRRGAATVAALAVTVVAPVVAHSTAAPKPAKASRRRTRQAGAQAQAQGERRTAHVVPARATGEHADGGDRRSEDAAASATGSRPRRSDGGGESADPTVKT